MKLHAIKYKLRQGMYKPRKSRFFTKKAMKEISDLEKRLEKAFGKKEKKKGEAKKDGS